MIVISDTSCISNLLTIGYDDLLRQIFGDVIIPPAVKADLLRFHDKIPVVFGRAVVF
jgi:predicted nucleic acid-binding protein